jgi:hypothetical protein
VVALSKAAASGEGLTLPRRQRNSFLARRWKPSTVSTNAAYVQRVLIPFFGDMPIATIQRSDVARWRDSLAAKEAHSTAPCRCSQ